MTRETLEALKELEAKATAGPWWMERCKQHNLPLIRYKYDDVPTWIAEASERENNANDFDFIVASRNTLPRLLAITEAAINLMEQVDNSCNVAMSAEAHFALDKLYQAIGGDDDKR